ncbi:GtrA family protein [Leucobacter coleopterorum]|nr:GtrA family protein [Leucobacter coleopterorum]
MRARLRSVFNSSGFRYLITGGLGFLAELVTIWIARDVFRASSIIAVGISFWVGMLASFLMQKLFTFRNTQKTAIALTRQSISFAVLVVINYTFTLGFVALMDPVWSSPELSRAIALLITTVWNYLAYKYIIFRR